MILRGREGVAKRTSSTVAATSLVSEVVMVWILMGWSLPRATSPTITVRVFLLTVLFNDSQYFCLGTTKKNNKINQSTLKELENKTFNAYILYLREGFLQKQVEARLNQSLDSNSGSLKLFFLQILSSPNHKSSQYSCFYQIRASNPRC